MELFRRTKAGAQEIVSFSKAHPIGLFVWGLFLVLSWIVALPGFIEKLLSLLRHPAALPITCGISGVVIVLGFFVAASFAGAKLEAASSQESAALEAAAKQSADSLEAQLTAEARIATQVRMTVGAVGSAILAATQLESFIRERTLEQQAFESLIAGLASNPPRRFMTPDFVSFDRQLRHHSVSERFHDFFTFAGVDASSAYREPSQVILDAYRAPFEDVLADNPGLRNSYRIRHYKRTMLLVPMLDKLNEALRERWARSIDKVTQHAER